MPEEKKIPLFTCSAGDYAASQDRNLTAYELSFLELRTQTYPSCFEELAIEAQKKGCEAIVDVKYNPRPGWYDKEKDEMYQPIHQVMGTGLKLKQEEP